MGMESVYKLSVLLNVVDNLSGQMNTIQEMYPEASKSLTQPSEPCRKPGQL